MFTGNVLGQTTEAQEKLNLFFYNSFGKECEDKLGFHDAIATGQYVKIEIMGKPPYFAEVKAAHIKNKFCELSVFYFLVQKDHNESIMIYSDPDDIEEWTIDTWFPEKIYGSGPKYRVSNFCRKSIEFSIVGDDGLPSRITRI